MTKEPVSGIEKLAEKDSKRKKKKETRKTEDGIVRRLAKQGLIVINTAPSVSTTRAEVLSALKSNLKVADDYNIAN